MTHELMQERLRRRALPELFRLYSLLDTLRYNTPHVTATDIERLDRAGYHVAQAMKELNAMLPDERKVQDPLTIQ